MSVPGGWSVAIAGYLAWLTAMGEDGGVARSTIDTRRQQLQRTARAIGLPDPWQVDGPALLAYWRRQRHVWANDTKRAHRAALRGFYAWAVQEGHVERSPALVLPRVKPTPPNPSPAPDEVYLPAFAAASPRERLMLVLAADHGLRRCEVAVVHSRDLVKDLDGWSLLVHGKGSRQRWVPLTEQAARMLLALPAGYAFPGDVEGHLSPRWVGKLVNRLLPGAWTIHKLRHRAGTNWREALKEGEDLRDVQELLGHASLNTTTIYVRANRAKMRRIVTEAAA